MVPGGAGYGRPRVPDRRSAADAVSRLGAEADRALVQGGAVKGHAAVDGHPAQRIPRPATGHNSQQKDEGGGMRDEG